MFMFKTVDEIGNLPDPPIDNRHQALKEGDGFGGRGHEGGVRSQKAGHREERLQPQRGVQHCLPREVVVHLGDEEEFCVVLLK